MRVSMRNQYSNFLYNLQDTQSKLMDLNQQSSSQKRINKPSDDAIGAGRVLNYRTSIAGISQYQSNIDVGKGWLSLADETLSQTSTVITTLKGLAEQGSTGTMTASDREATSYQVRQLFDQLISLSNTTYQGSSIFGGHKVDEDAFESGLMLYDQDGNNLGTVTGNATHSIVVQLVDDGSGSVTAGSSTNVKYRYSKDGGTSWSATLDSSGLNLDLDGTSMSLQDGKTYELSSETNTSTSTGSWFTIAPTAIYKGDSENQAAVTYDTLVSGQQTVATPVSGASTDFQIEVGYDSTNSIQQFRYKLPDDPGYSDWIDADTTSGVPILATPYGSVKLSGDLGSAASGLQFTVQASATSAFAMGADVNAVGQGVFKQDVMVRVDESATIGNGTDFQYSYSTDGGVNWSGGHISSNPSGGSASLLVPGGTLVLSAKDGVSALSQNDQFVIHPQTASRNLEISPGESVQLNNIGSEVFGGYYDHGSQPVFADSDVSKNIFVTVGKLVAALENNDQSGCADALENLQSSQDHLANQMASVGARENRLDVAGTVLSGLKINETQRMSTVEDVDLASLITEMSNQQLSYEAVLKSSSMIMKMGLVNYL